MSSSRSSHPESNFVGVPIKLNFNYRDTSKSLQRKKPNSLRNQQLSIIQEENNLERKNDSYETSITVNNITGGSPTPRAVSYPVEKSYASSYTTKTDNDLKDQTSYLTQNALPVSSYYSVSNLNNQYSTLPPKEYNSINHLPTPTFYSASPISSNGSSVPSYQTPNNIVSEQAGKVDNNILPYSERYPASSYKPYSSSYADYDNISKPAQNSDRSTTERKEDVKPYFTSSNVYFSSPRVVEPEVKAEIENEPSFVGKIKSLASDLTNSITKTIPIFGPSDTKKEEKPELLTVKTDFLTPIQNVSTTMKSPKRKISSARTLNPIDESTRRDIDAANNRYDEMLKREQAEEEKKREAEEQRKNREKQARAEKMKLQGLMDDDDEEFENFKIMIEKRQKAARKAFSKKPNGACTCESHACQRKEKTNSNFVPQKC